MYYYDSFLLQYNGISFSLVGCFPKSKDDGYSKQNVIFGIQEFT